MGKAVKARLFEALRDSPLAFRLLAPSRERPGLNRRAVRPGDDLVIEGFPRSANTFSYFAFQYAQGRPLKVANHFHSPAQFQLAARWRVPALLLLREPRAAVHSLMVYSDSRDAFGFAERWIRFHRDLPAIVDRLVVARFEDATGDFGRVIDRLNERFGTDFARFEHTADHVAAVGERLAAHEARHRQRLGAREATASSALPTPGRRALKARYEEALEQPKVEAVLERAGDLYERLARHGA